MRVVVDTNVYLSAILVGGVCEKVLEKLYREDHLVFISPYLFGEVRKVLAEKFHWTEAQISEVERDLKSRTILITPRRRLKVISGNHGDNRILECAVGRLPMCSLPAIGSTSCRFDDSWEPVSSLRANFSGAAGVKFHDYGNA